MGAFEGLKQIGGSLGPLGGMLGAAGGMGGTGFSTTGGTDYGQIQGSYTQNQNALQSQQALLAAMQAQGGLQNQSSVYNQLQGVANGTGPNPAQAMLNQSTGQNVANQAALMAGQRGASANPALMARQAAQQGAQIQQQAAGQGASMQAQQSLNALGGLGNMANTMASQQIGQTQANTAAQQNEQSILQGANTNTNNIQGQLANTTLGGQQKVIGGIMNGAGMAMGLAGGGMVQNFDMGGSVMPGAYVAPSTPMGPQSSFGQALANSNFQPFAAAPADDPIGQNWGKNKGENKKVSSQDVVQGNSVANPYMGSLGSSDMMASGNMAFAAKGGDVGSQLKGGGHVPGKAKVQGDSLKNDTVKAMLSPGEVVIPRSVMTSGDPIRGAADFVRAVMSKKGKIA